MSIKIALSGKSGVGKDTFADYLVEVYNFRKMSFAGPLKETLKSLFHFTDEQLYGSLKEQVDVNWGVSPREVLQKFGTDIVRDRFPSLFPEMKLEKDSFWIHCMKNNLAKNESEFIVVTDARFDNEIEFLRENGFKIINIVRDSATKIKGSSHESENGVKNSRADLILINNKDISYLHKQADEIMNLYRFFTNI